MIWNKYRFLEVQISLQCNTNGYDKMTILFSPLISCFLTPDAKNAENGGAKFKFNGVKNGKSGDIE